MSVYLTTPLESASRKEIDRILKNLGWGIDEFDKNCNVFTERVRTIEEAKKIKNKYPKGKFPDYVLYSSGDFKPLAIIEAKRIGTKLEDAIKQATEYAECLDIKIVFGVDGSIVEARWVKGNQLLKIDGQLVTELLSEKVLSKFVEQNKSEIISSRRVTQTKEDLIKVFKDTNDLLRQEGMREGVERFTEFANFLFLKLIDEIEKDREKNGEPRRMDKRYCWESFYQKEAQEMLDYINDTVLPKLVREYNHSGDVFSDKLKIQNPNILKRIVDKLSELTLLDVDSDVKGDAFEYFLKNSVTVGNDLGEYYTPRHIVKLMTDLVNPIFGDKVYDPCAGTGGFLIEAFRHIKRTCNLTSSTLSILENETIYGGELTGTAKIAKMNMILAGDGHTNILQQDSLLNPRKEEFEVVLTNFPFQQTTDYSYLYGLTSRNANAVFLKHVIDSLKPNGNGAVVVPDSVLFSKNTDTIKVRRELVEQCQIHAVIQLDVNTFVPYTKQPTSIIVFSKTPSTKNVWFFEVDNDGFSKTTKRKPIDNNDLPLLRSLWNDKSNSKNSFTVDVEKIRKQNYKLFLNFYKAYEPIKNPVELGEICEDFILGSTPNRSSSEFYGGSHIWVTITDMNQKYITDSQEKLTDVGSDNAGERRLIKKGGLLMSFKLTLGKTAFAGKDIYTNEAICELKLKKEFDTEETKEYLYHILPLINYMPYAQRAAKGLTLNKDLLPTVEIPFPDKTKRLEFVKKIKEYEKEKEILIKGLENNEGNYQKLTKSYISK